MAKFPAIKVGDWIERDVALGHCQWAQVVSVNEGEWVSAVYLDDDNPVRNEMVWNNDRWENQYPCPSGFKIRERGQIKHWRKILSEGPPFQIGGATPQLVYLNTKGTVWRRPRSAT